MFLIPNLVLLIKYSIGNDNGDKRILQTQLVFSLNIQSLGSTLARTHYEQQQFR